MATVQERNRSGQPARFEAFVEEQLARARWRIRFLDLARAGMVLLIGTLLYAVVMVCVDHVVKVPDLYRQIGLGVFGALALGYLALALVRPWLRRVNPYYAARQVEQTVPGAKNSVVNWLDLRDQKLAPAIRNAVGTRAARDLARAEIDQAISGRQVGFLAVVTALLVIAALATLSYLKWDLFVQQMKRVFLPASGQVVPTRTQIALLEPANGDTVVAVNQSVRFRVQVGGRVPDRGQPDAIRLKFRYPIDEIWQERHFLSVDGERDCREWVLRLPASEVQNGFLYTVAGGDYETPEYRVTVSSTPLPTGFDATYHYRDYLRWSDRLVRDDPNLKDLRGTEVDLVVRTNRTVREGRLLIQGEKPVPGALVADDPSALRFRLTLDRDSQYAIEFTSTEGETSTNPPLYTIQAVADRAPDVQLPRPDAAAPLPAQLPANGLLSLEAVANDDFGLTAVALRMRVKDSDVALDPRPYRPGKKFQFENGRFPTQLDYKDFVELDKVTRAREPFPLRPGTVLEYWLEAVDNCDYPEPNIGRSQVHELTISPPEMDQQKQDQQKQQAQNDQKQHEQKQDQDLKQQEQEAGQQDQAKQDDARAEEARKEREQQLKEQKEKIEKELREQENKNDQNKNDQNKNDPDKNDQNKNDPDKNDQNKNDPNQSPKGEDKGAGQAPDKADAKGPEQQPQGGNQDNKGQDKQQPEPNQQPGQDKQEGNQQGNNQKAEKKPEPQGNPNEDPGKDKGEQKPQPQGGDQAGDNKTAGQQEADMGQGQQGTGKQEPTNKPASGQPKGDSDQNLAGDRGVDKPEGKPEQAADRTNSNGQGKPQPAEGDMPPGDAKEGKNDDPLAGKGQGKPEGKPGEQGGNPKDGGQPQPGEEKAQAKADGAPQDQPGEKPPPGAGKGEPPQTAKAEPKPGGQGNADMAQPCQGDAKDPGQGSAPGMNRGEDKGQPGEKPENAGVAKGDPKDDKGKQPSGGMGDTGNKSDKEPTAEDIAALKEALKDPKKREEAARRLGDAAQNAKDPQVRKDAEEAMKGAPEAVANNRQQPPDQGDEKIGQAAAGNPKDDPMKNGQGAGQGKDGQGDMQTAKADPKDGGQPDSGPQGQKGTGKPMDGNGQDGQGQQPGQQKGTPGGGAPGGGDRRGDPSAGPSAPPDPDDPRFANRAGDLQLEDLRKKMTPDILKKLNMTQEDFDRFLKDWKEINGPREAEARTGPRTGGTFTNQGVRSTERRPPGTTSPLDGTGIALPPPEYRNPYRSFTEDLSKLKK